MTARQTILYFGCYLIVLGLLVMFTPNLVAALLFLPPPADHNVTMVGLLAVILGYYYTRMARADVVAFYQATVIGRFGATAAVVLLAVLSDLPFNYVIVVVVDAAGAIWTAKALRREGHAAVTI